jgi:Tol biopolymer transport system component
LRIPIGQPGSRTESLVPPVPIAASTLADHGPNISPDGTKIAFSSGRTGVEEIWTCDSDGLNTQQLTTFDIGLGATCPSWSPDGKSIAFDATVHGNRDIYTIRAEGGEARRLTVHPTADAQPSWSHDGQWIYFMSARSGTHQIWKMRADRGEPKQLTEGGGYQAIESPDGKLLFYVKERGERGIWSVPVNGGREVPVLEAAWHNAWAVTAQGIYYLDFDHATPSAVPVNRFDFLKRNIVNVAKISPPIARGVPAFAVSPDGRWLTWVASNDREGGLMLVRDFRW